MGFNRMKNSKKIKLSFILSASLFFLSGDLVAGERAFGSFTWLNFDINALKDSTGGQLKGSTDFSQGCFVQLIDAGADQTNSPAVYYGDGTSGDDRVVQTAWIGYGYEGADGIVSKLFEQAVVNQLYYVRAWSKPSPDFNQGVVPSNGALYNDASSRPLSQAHLPGSCWQYDGSNPEYQFAGAFGFSTAKTALPAPGSSMTVSAKSTASAVTVSWTRSAGATSYNIYRTRTPSTPSSGDKIGATSQLSFNDDGLTNGTWYYWVQPVNSAGLGQMTTALAARKTIAMPWLNLLLE
jgi:hypothetical protein